MKHPPLLPDETLRRVLRAAHINGTGVLWVAGAFTLAAAASHDGIGAVFSGLAMSAGALELYGSSRVRNGDPRGTRWLVLSQFYLLSVAVAYAAMRLAHFNPELLKPYMTDSVREAIVQSGMSTDDFLRLGYGLTYRLFAALSLAYQGGMAVYYLRRRRAVAAALEEA